MKQLPMRTILAHCLVGYCFRQYAFLCAVLLRHLRAHDKPSALSDISMATRILFTPMRRFLGSLKARRGRHAALLMLVFAPQQENTRETEY
ncbi:uncharacterized [Tachysurus ichikawai]